jgi:nitroreductase/Pyruvate/2-oxoacid:ferredoxin oxidoreductase delta subunit
MSILKVDEETCTKCGACVAVCPIGLILLHEGKYPRPIPTADQVCIRCGHCVTVCPTASITHVEIAPEDCPLLDESLNISLEQAAQLAMSRRSIRSFRDEPVPRDIITRLINIARYAPTGHNDQEIRWLVIDDAEKLQRFEAIGLDWMRVASQQNSAMADMLAGAIRRSEAGIPMFLRNAPALVVTHAGANNPIATIDSSIALATFDLVANSVGLGCCWAGFFIVAATTFPTLKEVLGLPEGRQVYGALMLGYPNYRYRRIPTRLPASIIWA